MKVVIYKAILFLLFTLVGLGSYGQVTSVARLQEIAAKELENKIANDQSVNDYLIEKGLKSRFIELNDGRTAYLQKVVEGVPYIIATTNQQARSTTGVAYITDELGDAFDLQGEGITVGVWDGGHVLADHVEFGGRVVNKGGASFSNHATHVTGTIAAAGINAAAKGMAPKCNVLAYYAFTNDLGPMATEAANGLILSNHSYGLILGWRYNGNNWQWYGGSGDKDLRFGHYSSKSATLDEIAFNAPYYSIVWAAGNDRNDVGDGTKEADGPYNIIAPSSAAKNVIAVGAITGFDTYQDPTSAVISDFSSWGPTNDGRIKPDLVADGVGVLSTSSSGVDSYVSQQGTSMAAPNVTGSLVPIQEYFRQQADTFMTAAALKALIIHTAKEAGKNDGPDPQYGWGVLNTVDALKVLRDRDDSDTLLIETKINSGETFELEIFSDGLTPLTATIAWTDPAGSPGALGNNTPMLVNDLDLRIVDSEGNVELPWALDLNNPLITAKVDNTRDNVEKIEFKKPQSRKYKIVVSHKGILENNEQAFGLVVTGGSIESADELYWIASQGTVQEGQNWAITSSGQPLTSVELNDGSLVFDNNSLISDNDVILFQDNLTVKNFIWLDESEAILDLGGKVLTVTNNLGIQNQNLIIKNGAIRFTSNTQKTLNLNFVSGVDFDIELANDSEIEITSDIVASTLKIEGKVVIFNKEITAATLQIEADAAPRIFNCTLNVSSKLTLKNDDLPFRGNQWFFDDVNFNGSIFNTTDKIHVNGDAFWNGNVIASTFEVLGSSTFQAGSLLTDSLFLIGGGQIMVSGGDSITVVESFVTTTSEDQMSFLKGLSVQEKSHLFLSYRDLFCINYFNVENFILHSSAVVNIEEGGSVINSENFYNKPCDELIYPNFKISESDKCVSTLIPILNQSVGPISDYLWESEFGNIISLEAGATPLVYFNDLGTFEVALQVSNAQDVLTYTIPVEIDSNNLNVVKVIENSKGLVSSQEGISYQWFKDGVALTNEVDRFYTPLSSGNYQVAYYVDKPGCPNRISEPFDIVTSLSDELVLENKNLKIYPNPVENYLNLLNLNQGDLILLYSIDGNVILKERNNTNQYRINFANLNEGVYILEIIGGGYKTQKRIIKID